MISVQVSLDKFGFEIPQIQIPLKEDYMFINKHKQTIQTKLSDFGIIHKPRTLGRI